MIRLHVHEYECQNTGFFAMVEAITTDFSIIMESSFKYSSSLSLSRSLSVSLSLLLLIVVLWLKKATIYIVPKDWLFEIWRLAND